MPVKVYVVSVTEIPSLKLFPVVLIYTLYPVAALPKMPPKLGAFQVSLMVALPLFVAATCVGSSGKKTKGLPSLLLKNFKMPL